MKDAGNVEWISSILSVKKFTKICWPEAEMGFCNTSLRTP